MLRRVFLGLVLGLLVGGAVAAGLVAGLDVRTFAPGGGGELLAYFAAAFCGVLTGLVAGKPIWASGAKIEAGLKAFFGALLGAGVMFALRKWAGAFPLDLPAIGAHGATPIGELPAVSLPLVAAVLGGFFELDNTAEGEAKESAAAPKRGAPTPGRARVPSAETVGRVAKSRPGEAIDVDSRDDGEAGSKRAKH